MQRAETKVTEVLTVSELNRCVRDLLEKQFGTLWVEGEISNFAAPVSGHWYFCIKDNQAQVRCAMFKSHIRKLDFIPKNGMQVLIKTKVSLYENRGEFQLIVEEMEERGEGKLKKAFEVLKKKLAAEGLFDAKHKKNLPKIPRCIGVITSETGAAIRDILNVLKRRFPLAPVIIYPTLVQGQKAAPAIQKALQLANTRKECDVLLLTRGGGSLEDLWPFNEEIVAREIFRSELPIVSGVGHEIDFTIADFVADLRAPTPSAAAELITPDLAEIRAHLTKHQTTLTHNIKKQLHYYQQKISWQSKHLIQQHPKRILQTKMQDLDHFVLKMKQSISNQLLKTKNRLSNYAGKLDALSPLQTLKRGYAITLTKGHMITHINDVCKGDIVDVKLQDGCFSAVVESLGER